MTDIVRRNAAGKWVVETPLFYRSGVRMEPKELIRSTTAAPSPCVFRVHCTPTPSVPRVHTSPLLRPSSPVCRRHHPLASPLPPGLDWSTKSLSSSPRRRSSQSGTTTTRRRRRRRRRWEPGNSTKISSLKRFQWKNSTPCGQSTESIAWRSRHWITPRSRSAAMVESLKISWVRRCLSLVFTRSLSPSFPLFPLARIA